MVSSCGTKVEEKQILEVSMWMFVENYCVCVFYFFPLRTGVGISLKFEQVLFLNSVM